MKIAFLFPGQGSQAIAMLDALADQYTLVKHTYTEASEVLGYDLWNVVREGPEARLNQTEITQPALLAAGVACYRVWREQGGAQPAMMAGHSLGEYTALVCANALDFSTAVSVVAQRGRLMQQAVPEGKGAMAAILGLDEESVQKVCEEAAQGEIVSAANFNSPGQIVIAGLAEAVQRAMDLAKQAGAKRAVQLAVSVPSHCQLLSAASERLAEQLNTANIKSPEIPVVHNVDAAVHTSPTDILNALTQQLYMPVRWVDGVRGMATEGTELFVECGPGKVLTGLCKRIDRSIKCLSLYDPKTLDTLMAEEVV